LRFFNATNVRAVLIQNKPVFFGVILSLVDGLCCNIYQINQVEFNPALFYNFSSGEAGIGIKGIISKAICTFLNSRGGFLFNGFADKGEIQGLEFD